MKAFLLIAVIVVAEVAAIAAFAPRCQKGDTQISLGGVMLAGCR